MVRGTLAEERNAQSWFGVAKDLFQKEEDFHCIFSFLFLLFLVHCHFYEFEYVEEDKIGVLQLSLFTYILLHNMKICCFSYYCNKSK
ncbi:hypothetical protein Fmac_010952 [Flemingia macrophylla]|uniref:Uncharacterized protein n=1 Tax=Flemingia macrophylla TaxID=520843 RepID=A0ABD1ML24_9FABA